MKITKNPMSPQDLTIFTHHEDKQVHHANVKDASTTTRSKTSLQNLQTLNKYINAKKLPLKCSTKSLWHHKIHLLHEDPLGLHSYNQSVSTKWNQDLQTKKIQIKLGTNPTLSPHHSHKVPLNHASKLCMTSWWKKPSSNHENQPRHQTIKELKVHIISSSKENK